MKNNQAYAIILVPREFAFSLLFFATRTFSLRKQHFASVESLPDLRVGIPMQKMKFTTLFRCGCASGDNGSSGYFLEDKMESLKLQKLCGYIIYIKSVIATILASILFGSGIYSVYILLLLKLLNFMIDVLIIKELLEK